MYSTAIAAAFTIDEGYDIHVAGCSRYGNYLAGRSHLFLDDDGQLTGDPVVFAAIALSIACSPVMSPGYVYTHPRITNFARRWDDEGRLAAFGVTLIAPLPVSIAEAIRGQDWQDWRRDWSSEFWFEPDSNDRPAAYTVVTIRIPVAGFELPTPLYEAGAPQVAAAKAAVAALCAHLNTHLATILTALDQ